MEELHTRVETFERADGKFDFRIVSAQNGLTLCSSNQGYEHEQYATDMGSRVVRSAVLGDITFASLGRIDG